MEQELFLVFPEQASKDYLVQSLVRVGFLKDSSDSIISWSKEDVVKKFYVSLAALPRRFPRSNRRGRLLQERRKKEPKVSHTNVLLKNAMHQKSQQPRATSTVEQSASATPELDRLAARSKAAKQSTVLKRKLSPAEQNVKPKVTPAKRPIINRKPPDVCATTCTDNKKTPVCTTKPKALGNSTINSKNISIKKTDLNHTDTDKHSTTVKTCEATNDQSKKQVVNKKPGKRIKLKRNSFSSPAVECAKIKKTS
uniref:Uncharacterized protein LOC100175197 n=1 Tax=Phallusia mammillata TaxID=59560 RepID=A0A6F9DH32_9ASCI|nr:uncharacterized protein LOC100175197 [Phallusia mammillata]